MISIFTNTLGREFYLKKNLKAVERSLSSNIQIEHHIIFSGCSPSNEFINFLEGLTYCSRIKIEKTQEAHSIGKNLNHAKSQAKYPLFLKLDDDAEILTSDFFDHVLEISTLKPNSVFSPFPIGLINNLGGVKAQSHEVVFSEKMDTHYTIRKTVHVGGFARVCQTELIKQIEFTDAHNEDVEFSNFARSKGIDLFYLENAIAVEHMESTLGQHKRYGRDYFKARF